MSERDQRMILVTGSAGNVGTELIKQLSNSDAIFRTGFSSNESADKIRKISSRAQLVQLDFDKPETLSRAAVVLMLPLLHSSVYVWFPMLSMFFPYN